MMKTKFQYVFIAALAIILSAPFIASAAQKEKLTRVEGKITAFNLTSGVLTVHSKKDSTDISVTVTPETKYSRVVNVGLAALTVGNKISAQSQTPIAAGSTTVAAERIAVLSPLSEVPKHTKAKSVIGTITALTPTLTISTDDGSDIVINTTADTRVNANQPATESDVVVGNRVQVFGKITNGVFTAFSVTVHADGAHHGHRKSVV